MTTQLRKATVLADNLLVMHYQPRIRVLDGAVVGFEALMRLRTDEGALLAPADFMDQAVASGALEQLEIDALAEVCRQTEYFAGLGYRLQGSFNVSAERVADPGPFEVAMRTVLADTGLSARQLILELPASVVDEITPDTVRGISRLKKLGVMLSLEDFGPASAPVERLASLGFGELKLDRQLMAAIPHDGVICSFVRTYAIQVRALGMRMVAAGVETRQQRNFLAGVGIEFAQGYYYERPLPAASFAELVGEPVGAVDGRL